MKRQVLAVVVGSLFALPAFAADPIGPGDDANYTPSVSASASKTRDVLVAAQRTGAAILKPELAPNVNQLYWQRRDALDDGTRVPMWTVLRFN